MPGYKDKAFWKTVLKVALGAVAVIAFVGGGLYFTVKFNTYAPSKTAPGADWGISKDTPIHNQR